MSRPEPVEVLLRNAAQLLRSNRTAEAIAAHERLLRADPDLPDSWYNLAWLQRQDRRFEAALNAYREALERGIAGREEVHLNRAVIWIDHLGRGDLGEAELKAALAIEPRYLPALLNLGNLYEDRGDRPGAEAAYERVLDADPGNALALSRLAGLSAVSGPDDALIGRLRRALSDPARSAGEQALIGFGLGQLLDSAGCYEPAFAAFAEANKASKASAGPSGTHYDAAAQERLVDRLIATFDRPAQPAAGEDARAPIFICGMFRSGSTLAEQILAGHPKVTAGGELDLLPELVDRHLSPYPERAAGLGRDVLARLRRDYGEGLGRMHPDRDLVTDKRPDNFLHIGLIKSLFPKARIVHTRRNPLDNCLSVYFLHLSHRMPYALDLADTAHWYRQYRRLMDHWKRLYPDDIHDFDYDRLVADPRPAIERLLDFCGLDWDERCLSFHSTPTLVKTASAWQVRKPLYRVSSGRWRNYRACLGPLREGLGTFCRDA